MNDFDQFDAPLAIVKTLREIPDVQEPCVRWARARGFWARKFSSPANRSVMDYLFGKYGWVELVEFKAPGKTLTPQQAEEHKSARSCGMRPVTIDNVETFKQYFLKVEELIHRPEWVALCTLRGKVVEGHEQ